MKRTALAVFYLIFWAGAYADTSGTMRVDYFHSGNNESEMFSLDQVVAIHKSGDPATKVDLLLMGDGYTVEEQEAFIAKVHELTEILFATSLGCRCPLCICVPRQQ